MTGGTRAVSCCLSCPAGCPSRSAGAGRPALWRVFFCDGPLSARRTTVNPTSVLCDPTFITVPHRAARPGRCRLLLLASCFPLSLLLLFLSATMAAGQDQPADSRVERYEIRRDHDPNGIGKFYMGREIAHVMGYQAAGWLDRPEREEEERLSLLIEALQLKPGMTVADIGAGSGRISVMMAREVAPKGRVMAVDIQDEMLTLLKNKARQLKVTNITPVLSTAKSPRLEPGSVDLALMVDVYHEFNFPYEMMQSLAAAMKPGGRVVLVEYRKEDPEVRRRIKLVHTMTEKQVRTELEQPEFGLKWKKTLKPLPLQHIIVFEKQPAAGRPDGAQPRRPEAPALPERFTSPPEG